MTVGDIVKYSAPVDAIEAAARFELVEDNGSRVMIRLVDSGLQFPGVETVSRGDVELAS